MEIVFNSQIRKCFYQPYLARIHESITIEVKEIKKCRNLANNLINVSHAIYLAKYLVGAYLGIGFFLQNANIFYCNLVNAVPCLILGKGTLLKEFGRFIPRSTTYGLSTTSTQLQIAINSQFYQNFYSYKRRMLVIL